MLIDETDEELFERIEALIFILGDRIPANELRDQLDDLLDSAISYIEVDQSE